MDKKILTSFAVSLLLTVFVFFAYKANKEPIKQALTFGAPSANYRIERTILPETDSYYELGTTTKAWLRIFTDEICLAGDCQTTWSAGGGEANTASSLGTGLNIFDSKSDVDLRFNTLLAGTNVTLSTTTNDNTIVISATGGSGGTGNVSTSTSETAGNLAYWTSTDGTPALLGKVATSSLTINSPLTTSGTAGALVGGTNLTIDIDDIKAVDLDLTDITLGDFTNDTNFIDLTDISATWPILYNNGTGAFTFGGLSTTTNSGLSQGFNYVGSGGILKTAASSSLFGYTPLSNQLTKGYTIVGDDSGTAQATSSIFISSTGNVGIGTTSPSAILQLSTTGSGDAPRMRFTNGTTGYGASDGTYLGISNGNEFSIINYESSPIRLFSGGNEIVRINPSGGVAVGSSYVGTDPAGNGNMIIQGNVGIGTTSPSQKLHVEGNVLIKPTSNTNGVRITGPSDGSGTDMLFNITNAANTVNWLGVKDNGEITMNGNVGIGTTGPASALHVIGITTLDGGDNTRIDFRKQNSSQMEIGYGSSGMGGTHPLGGYFMSNDGISLGDYAGDTYLYVNSTTGNVGIGTTGPTEKLTVNGAASILGNNPLRLYNAGASANGGIRNASTDYTQIFGINGTQIMNNTLAAALVTVLNNGNVGIGTTSPNAKLWINGSFGTYASTTAISENLSTTTTYLRVTDTSTARTETLPICNGTTLGNEYQIKDASGAAATNNITVARNAADTIDGATSYVINTNYGTVRVKCAAASAWDIMSKF